MSFFKTITQKFFGLSMLSSVIPIIFAGTLFYQVASRVLQTQAIQSNQQLLISQRNYLDLQLKQIESLIYSLSGVEEIIDAINAQDFQGNTYLALATQARIGYILNNYTNLDGLISIDIFSKNSRHFHVGDTLNTSDLREDVRQKIYERSKQNRDSRVVWIGIENNVNANSNESLVVAASKFLTVADGDAATAPEEATGLLVVNYSLNYFYDYFSQIDFGDDGYLLIVDSSGKIIYHPDRALFGKQIDYDLLNQLKNSNRNSIVGTINQQEMLIDYQVSDVSDWMLISFVPTQELLKGVAPIRAATLLTVVASLTIVALVAVKISREIVEPVQKITQHFKALQEEKFSDVEQLPEERRDEIGDLSRGFNSLLQNLQIKKEIEQALRESEQRYTLALQGANDGIWDWDLKKNIIHFSSRWKDMLSFPQHINLDNPEVWLEQIHKEDIAQVIVSFSEHLKGKIPHFESEHRLFKYQSNDYIWVLVRGLATRDEEGKPTRIAGSMADITVRKAAEEELRYGALYDALTGLPNRAYFGQRIHELLHPNSKVSNPILSAVILLDLDRFKVINDSLGHAAGDCLLQKSSQRLLSCLRPEDFVARLGGDEFAILLTDMSSDTFVEEIAQRIQSELGKPVDLEGHEVYVSASLGIALVKQQGSTSESLLRDADTALYQAKDNGRAQYAIFDEQMHDRMVKTLETEAWLKQALHRNEFVLHYQPIIALEKQEIIAVEALIRWQHPEKGLTFPNSFISLAEEIGLISAIGEWVIKEACRQTKLLQVEHDLMVRVSVNISAQQLKNHDLLNYIKSILEEFELSAHCLQLEITESVAMENIDVTRSLLAQIRDMGVRIVIDDFGTSYSSLGYLRQLPINGIKIDRSFIQDIPDDTDAIAITSAILAMAKILDLEVTAEGVETTSQVAFLISHDCDAAQGYLFGRPMAVEQMIELQQKVGCVAAVLGSQVGNQNLVG